MGCLLALIGCAATLVPSADYQYLIGFSDSPAASWSATRNGQNWLAGPAVQSFVRQTVAGVQNVTRDGALSLDEGSIEMRVALRGDPGGDAYKQSRNLFSYRAANGEYLQVTQSASGILYLGGTVQGQWESAYGGGGSMLNWTPGSQHHLMATWSASSGRMKFYVDGTLTADTNEQHYWAPAASGATFQLDATWYDLSAVVLWRKALDDAEVRSHAARVDAPHAGEVWLPVGGLAASDTIAFAPDGGDCDAASFLWLGIPIHDPVPNSSLLAPGTTELDLQVQTSAPGASCRYSINQSLPYDAMTPLAGHITGLTGDPANADAVYVRCSHAPDYAMRLLYRSVGNAKPHYPRKSNLWGSSNMLAHGPDFASKVDLYLGAEMQPADIRALRARNANILILTSINTVENKGLPDDYYLHDIHGNRIEVWPNTYRLNLTKPYVAEYQARFAYQKMLDTGMLYDGCFFDNFFTSQSWLKSDIHGNPVQIDADEDGKPDDPAWLDAAWRQGVFHELAVWRQLMPYAYTTGHLPNPFTPELGPIFNGNSILFWGTNVLDGTAAFADYWNVYQGWEQGGLAPVLDTMEASPQNQIAYGYGYDILRAMPAATQQFARDFYRYLRFPLAVALMGSGYFHRDLGDIYHGIDWWYDEYDFDLGFPLGAPEVVPADPNTGPPPNLLLNGDMEQELGTSWTLTIGGGAQATLRRDPADAAEGQYAARVDITATALNWQVDFHQMNRSLVQGKSYDLKFWAKADAPRKVALSSQKGSPDWRSYGLNQSVAVGTSWRQFTVTFEANATVDDSRIQFFVGDQTGTVWFDGIELREHPPAVLRRYFSGGAVVLNATKQTVTVAMPDGYARFNGTQAPRQQYIVDDEDAGAFTVTQGSWENATFDTGQWKSAGPFYHNWGKQCRLLRSGGAGGGAQWNLQIPEDGTYTISAWWAAAPAQPQWTKQAVYEVVTAAGQVVATGTLDQTAAGDQWRQITAAPVALRASDNAVLRIRNGGATGTLVADGILVASAVARFNDGSPARSVTLAPMDAILLRVLQ